MSSVLNFVGNLSNISLIIISFGFLCLILIIIFLFIISERICPLFCLCCCSSECHNKCSSKIHRLSDTYYISRKQLSLKITSLNIHVSLNSTSTNISHSTQLTQPSLINHVSQPVPLELQGVCATTQQKQKQFEKPKLQNRHTMPVPSTNNNAGNKVYTECETQTPIQEEFNENNPEIEMKSPNYTNSYSPRSSVYKYENENEMNEIGIQSDNEMNESNHYLENIIDNNNTSCFARLILCFCIAYFYWDRLILIEYKKKMTVEKNNGMVSKSFKTRIIKNISYFGLFMNLILLFQCICIFILYEFNPILSYKLFINFYYIFHNLWLVLCNISLTGILLNILEIVKSTNEMMDENAKLIKNITSYMLIIFCLIFILSTIIFHIFAILFNTIYWDIIGGIVRNLLIVILCLILAKNSFSLKKSVSIAFKRVSNSINNIHQINEHKKIINVLMILFISSCVLSILVAFAATQYFNQLFINTNNSDLSNQSIGKQRIPGTYITDLLWLFIKLMSSFIILYYAIINVKQKRKLMIQIINEQIAAKKDKKRQSFKRKRSYNILHKQQQTI